MAISDQTYKYSRATFGNMRSRGSTRNIVSVSYGHTNFKKAPANNSTTGLMVATAVPTAGKTFTKINSTVIDPDVPRALSITIAATTPADIAAGTVVITGTNIEGKVISENFAVVADTAGVTTGDKAFKTVTSVAVPAQDGGSVTIAVGHRNIIGLNHRLPSDAVVKVVTQTTAGARVLQSAPSLVLTSTTNVEGNAFVPATDPNGSNVFTAHYLFSNWHLDPLYGNPSYGA